jgi:hypothetical protein
MRLTLPFTALTLTAAAVLSSACVTRTVYVVDDRPDTTPAPSQPGPVAQAEPQAPDDEAGINDVEQFYEPLAPYGSWVAYPGYGMVWVPSQTVVGAGYRPYTHGHWEYSEWGWTWVDHHPFGWATGHYGRWFYDSSYGWVWVPGTTWSPAWVSWRTGGAYIGWAPMPPGSYYGARYTTYDTAWVYTYDYRMGSPYVASVLIVGDGYSVCYYETRPYYSTYVVYGRTYYRGPDYDSVQRSGGRVVHRPVRDADRERPVSRPPEGTSIARGRTRTDARTDRETSTGRSRDGRDDGSQRRDGDSRDRGDTGRDRGDTGRGDNGGRDRGDAGGGDNNGGGGRGNDRDDNGNNGNNGRPGRDINGRENGRDNGPDNNGRDDDRNNGNGRGNERDDDRTDPRGRDPRAGGKDTPKKDGSGRIDTSPDILPPSSSITPRHDGEDIGRGTVGETPRPIDPNEDDDGGSRGRDPRLNGPRGAHDDIVKPDTREQPNPDKYKDFGAARPLEPRDSVTNPGRDNVTNPGRDNGMSRTPSRSLDRSQPRMERNDFDRAPSRSGMGTPSRSGPPAVDRTPSRAPSREPARQPSMSRPAPSREHADQPAPSNGKKDDKKKPSAKKDAKKKK